MEVTEFGGEEGVFEDAVEEVELVELLRAAVEQFMVKTVMGRCVGCFMV